MTPAELLILATAALHSAPHHPAISPELCAAICWIESRGTATARGDGGKARGLAQFHNATWMRFRPRFPTGCALHRSEPARFIHADCPRCAMSALIAELRYAANRAPKERADDIAYMHRFLCRFHNAGRFDDAETEYVRNVIAMMRELSASRAATSQPAAPEEPKLTERPGRAANPVNKRIGWRKSSNGSSRFPNRLRPSKALRSDPTSAPGSRR